jgi:hypothetical protein
VLRDLRIAQSFSLLSQLVLLLIQTVKIGCAHLVHQAFSGMMIIVKRAWSLDALLAVTKILAILVHQLTTCSTQIKLLVFLRSMTVMLSRLLSQLASLVMLTTIDGSVTIAKTDSSLTKTFNAHLVM